MLPTHLALPHPVHDGLAIELEQGVDVHDVLAVHGGAQLLLWLAVVKSLYAWT